MTIKLFDCNKVIVLVLVYFIQMHYYTHVNLELIRYTTIQFAVDRDIQPLKEENNLMFRLLFIDLLILKIRRFINILD